MAAANTDKFKKTARKWVGQIGSGGVADDTVTTIPLSSATNLPTDTAIVATIDRVDSNGTKTPSLEESVIGVVSVYEEQRGQHRLIQQEQLLKF